MILGVTGHQNLGEADELAWVTTALREAIFGHAIEFGLTSLAAGTDQLFAEQCLAAKVAYHAIIPCEGYDACFADEASRTNFRILFGQAQRIYVLPFPSPTETAFFAAGKWIAANCDLLVAVWNGLAARGLGGTGDVVNYATSLARPVLHINPVARMIGFI